jgi:hypothetical protein
LPSVELKRKYPHSVYSFLQMGCLYSKCDRDEKIWWKSKSKLLYDWRSVNQPVCFGVEPTLGLVIRYYFLSEGCCLKVSVLFLWGALYDERTGLQFAVQSLNGPSRAEPVTILHCLIWDSPPLGGPDSLFISPRHWVYGDSVDWIHLAHDVNGSCEHGNETSGFIRKEKFEYLSYS